MKITSVKILKLVLKKLAQWTVGRYQPEIVGVTGTVGKTSTKEAIKTVLEKYRRVRASSGNFNNEIGLPLAILGDWKKIGGFFFWLKVFWVSLFRLVFKMKYPEILILEYAADRPGDLKYLLSIARPKIGVITAVGDIPAHVEFYSGPEAVIREKSRLVEQLSALGFAVLNIDDKAAAGLKEYTRAHLMTFGFNEKADVRISNFEIQSDDKPWGISFKIEHKGSFVPIRLNNVLGRSQAYSAAAAATVGLISGLNLVKIAEAMADFQALPGRMRLIDGVKGSCAIDDSYNASPLSMHAALETLKEIHAERKIAVLGDMLEIGKYAVEAHETIGDLAAKIVDILITVGPRAKFIAESAKASGFSEDKIFSFDIAEEAGKKLQELIKKGDLVLIKASRAMKLDKIVEEIKAPIV